MCVWGGYGWGCSCPPRLYFPLFPLFLRVPGPAGAVPAALHRDGEALGHRGQPGEAAPPRLPKPAVGYTSTHGCYWGWEAPLIPPPPDVSFSAGCGQGSTVQEEPGGERGEGLAWGGGGVFLGVPPGSPSPPPLFSSSSKSSDDELPPPPRGWDQMGVQALLGKGGGGHTRDTPPPPPRSCCDNHRDQSC